MRYAYNFIAYLLTPYLIFHLLWRSIKAPKYRQRIPERFAFFNMPEKYQQGFWVHAVSVGETMAAIPLVKKIQQEFPDMPIVFTNMTPTGSDRAKAAFGDSVFHVYAPYDLPSVVKRFLEKVKPKITIILETELWPNMIYYCQQQKIPTLIANARLSERSATGYLRFKKFINAVVRQINIIAVQSDLDGERYARLGANKNQIKKVGNIKFDITVSESVLENSKKLREQLGLNRSVWIAASTHEGEEEKVLNAFAKVRQQHPDCLLLLVPRHPERFAKVADLCKEKKYSIVLRSEGRACFSETDIFLGDTMGEMLLFYGASDLVFVGGSLVPTGGHNLLEPALFGLGIITGENMFNFAEIERLFKAANAAIFINNEDELASHVIHLLNDKQLRHQYGDNAKQVVENNRGSLQRHINLIKQLL